ncbi:MAG: glycosyltransferase family 4 protein [Pyrinomonadaceae bacterium]
MLSPYSNVKGPLPKHTPHLVAALRSLGCEVVTESWGRHSDHESLIDKVVGRVKDVIRIRRILSGERFSVLVVKTAHDWNTLIRDVGLLLSTRGLRPATILQFHGSQPNVLLRRGHGLFKILSGWLMRLSDAFMVLSSEERDQWSQFFPAGKFFVVCNPFVSPINEATITPQCIRNLPPKVPLLLFVGRLIREKGIFDLLDALSHLKASIAFHLLVAGDGPHAEQIKKYLTSLGVAEHVTLAGHLEATELAMAYHTATIFVLPTWWNEGFPTVIAEAMNAGLPIVTTPIRGMADHLQEGSSALFAPPRDPIRLAAIIKRLLSNPSLRAKMSQANQNKVRDFAPDVVGLHYLDILKQVAAWRDSYRSST